MNFETLSNDCKPLQEAGLRQVGMGVALGVAEGIVASPVASPENTFSTNVQVERMERFLLDGHAEAISIYDSIPPSDRWRRKAVQDLVCSQQIRDLEAQIDGEALIVMRETNEELSSATLERVKEGMDYYVGLVAWKAGRKK